MPRLNDVLATSPVMYCSKKNKSLIKLMKKYKDLINYCYVDDIKKQQQNLYVHSESEGLTQLPWQLSEPYAGNV